MDKVGCVCVCVWGGGLEGHIGVASLRASRLDLAVPWIYSRIML